MVANFSVKENFIRKGKLRHHWQLGNPTLSIIAAHHKGSCVSIDRNIVATGSPDKQVKIWNVEAKVEERDKELCTINGNRGSVNSVELAGDQLFTASHKEIILFDLQTQKLKTRFQHGLEVYKFKSNDDTFISCGRDKTLKLWDLRTNCLVRTFRSHSDSVVSLFYDGQKLFSGSEDKAVKEWDLATAKCVNTFTHHNRGVRFVQYENDVLTSAGEDRTIKQYHVKSLNLIETINTKNYVIAMASGRYGMVYNSDSTLRCIPRGLAKGEPYLLAAGDVSDPHWMIDLAIDTEERRLVAMNTNGSLYIWDFLTTNKAKKS